jgi:hypothetical protein
MTRMDGADRVGFDTENSPKLFDVFKQLNAQAAGAGWVVDEAGAGDTTHSVAAACRLSQTCASTSLEQKI